MRGVRRARLIAGLYVMSAALLAPAALLAAEGADAPAEQQQAAPAEQAPAQQQQNEAQAPATTPEEATDAEAPAAQPDEPTEAAAEEDDAEPTARAAKGSVTIKDFLFAPKSITVSVGEPVVWSNSGPSAHTATADDGSFDTGLLRKGQSRSHTFTKAGTFSYFCEPHPNMKGTIRVVGSSSGGGGSGGGGSSGDASGTSGSNGEAGAGGDEAGSSSGSGLPASGLETGVLAALGAALLALGIALRRRAA
jgi:plastocyanin